MEGVKSDEEKKKIRKAEWNKRYYDRHKEEIAEKVLCEVCGSEYQKYTRKVHERSKKHRMVLMEMKLNELKKQ